MNTRGELGTSKSESSQPELSDLDVPNGRNQGAEPGSLGRPNRRVLSQNSPIWTSQTAGTREQSQGAWDVQIGEFSARTLRFGRPSQTAGTREQSQGAWDVQIG